MDLNAIKAAQKSSTPIPAKADVQNDTPDDQAQAEDTSDTYEEDSLIVIEAVNPTEDEMKSLCETLSTDKLNVKPTKFNFKKSIDKDSDTVTQRQALELPIPVPSLEGVIAILEADGKQLELLMDAIESIIVSNAREIISDDITLNASNFPYEKLFWEYISNLPKAQRGGGIPKETWEEFAEDYIIVMQAATGKSLESVSHAARIYTDRFSKIKTATKVLKFLVEQLAIYAEKSPNAEKYSDVLEFLLKKADTYINSSQDDLLANL